MTVPTVVTPRRLARAITRAGPRKWGVDDRSPGSTARLRSTSTRTLRRRRRSSCNLRPLAGWLFHAAPARGNTAAVAPSADGGGAARRELRRTRLHPRAAVRPVSLEEQIEGLALSEAVPPARAVPLALSSSPRTRASYRRRDGGGSGGLARRTRRTADRDASRHGAHAVI